MKPPEDVSPSELWLKLSESPRPSEVVDFPRKGANREPIGKVRIQVLPNEEHDAARIRAQTKLRERARLLGHGNLTNEDMRAPGVAEVLGDMTAREVLAVACVAEKPFDEYAKPLRYPRIFPDAESIGATLSADELSVLFNLYVLVQNKYGPFEGNLSDDDQEAWIRRLEEGGETYPLASLPWPQLVALTSSLAVKVSSLYRILSSQWSSLPDTLRSDLASFSTAIISYGEPLAAPGTTGSESLGEDLITTEQAARLAESLGKHKV